MFVVTTMDNTGNSNAVDLYKMQLFSASSAGDANKLAEVVAVARSQLSLDERDERGWTPLMLAARNGHVDVVEYLLKTG